MLLNEVYSPMFSFPSEGDELPVLHDMALELPLAWPKVVRELKSSKASLEIGSEGSGVGLAVEGVAVDGVMGRVRGRFICALSRAISS